VGRHQRHDASKHEVVAMPERDAAAEISIGYLKRAIEEGMRPAAVADLVVDAVGNDRFGVFPHADFLELAMERFHTIGEGLNPDPPEEIPGMPPRSQMMAEVMAAMLPPE
jgi:hypothetical protein